VVENRVLGRISEPKTREEQRAGAAYFVLVTSKARILCRINLNNVPVIRIEGKT
jgi:hypothetical protein